MSGLDLLFRSAIDYERTHQVVLYTLFQNSGLSEILVGLPGMRATEWEPERQLFDLGLSSDTVRFLIEIKMWSPLGETQIKRQVAFLEEHAQRVGYVLLGTSWFEFDEVMISELTKGLGMKIGYERLIDALDRLLVLGSHPPQNVYELALGYRNALESQFDTLKGAAQSGREKDKIFYYSLFWRLKQNLPDFKTAIYTATNRGGPVYILNNQEWHTVHLGGVEVQLFHEVVNDRLCIKFWTDTKDDVRRRQIRDEVRSSLHAVLDERFRLTDTGRLGTHMTACQVEHDFSNIVGLDESVTVFASVGRALPHVVERLRSQAG